ncbi:type II toxin-antitoxin system CcdA family antitoxin [Variovorax sp. J22R24]|uniref:type II toxin-antitoxin system CcdA family antitoxin n=1 Tax=Variovorax gracilis TaxID=3053502 RepID=UPI002576F2AB|nr:type II toxin-antitoxin system CcdA family antitoxin [Variovorax sp. J22R24]MDM0109883.1 type II toxin-antitoxin system CcdA family antitoxin [Variovorax sp. J22R24]
MKIAGNVPSSFVGEGGPRRSFCIALKVELVAEARAAGINVAQAAESGLAAAVAARRKELWLAENATALQSSNTYVEQNGLPLSKWTHRTTARGPSSSSDLTSRGSTRV